MSWLTEPFGIVMKFIANHLAFGNYGIAIFLFTLFVKVLLLPLSIKQQKSTIKTQKLQPELKALQESCGNDKELLMQEQQKLYAKYNVNPMSGCLPTLIQLPVLLVIYNIIIQPLTYVAGLSSDVITKLTEIASLDSVKNSSQLLVNAFFINNPDAVTEEVTSLLGGSNFVNMKFLCWDLGTTPTACFSDGIVWKYVPLLLIPIITLLSQYLLQWITNPDKKKNKKDKKDSDPTQRSMGLMLKLMPLMTFFIALTTPAGLGFYWAVSNLLTLAQTYITNKLIASKKEG